MHVFSLQIILLLTLAGSIAGFLAGLLGIGGGIILVPFFLWVFPVAGFSPEVIVHVAFGTSLAIIIPTSASSTFGHRKLGNVDWNQVRPLVAGGLCGAVVGASLAAGLSGPWLKGLFGAMQILVALKLYFSHPYFPPERGEKIPLRLLLFVGLSGGAFSAFFGVGGGVIAVPMMVMILHLPIHLAVGNSSALIVFSSLFGALSYVYYGWNLPSLPPFSLGYVNLLVTAIVTPFTVLFARLGVRVAGRLRHDTLVHIFAGLLMLIGLRMLARLLW